MNDSPTKQRTTFDMKLYSFGYNGLFPVQVVNGKNCFGEITETEFSQLLLSCNKDMLLKTVENIKSVMEVETFVRKVDSNNGVIVYHELQTSYGKLEWTEFILSDYWHTYFNNKIAGKKIKLDSAWE